jgi:hypothetical protein
MPARVVDEKRISINAKLYWLARPGVQFYVASQQPGKVALGEYSDDTNPLASTVVWKNFTGGIGVHTLDPKRPEHLDRCWYSTCKLRHHGQVVLPDLVVTTAQAAAADIQTVMEFKSEIYSPHGTAVYLYNNAADTHSNVRTLLNNATDWVVGLVGSTETLVVATGVEVDYATDSATWARNTGQAIKYVVFWKNLL